MNKVILAGRIAVDPEMRVAEEKTSVVNFSVAVTRRYKKEGVPETDFIRCVAFGKTAEFINQYFKKGSGIILEGSIRVENYTDKDGNKRSSVQVAIERVEFPQGGRDKGEKNKSGEEASQSKLSIADFEEIDSDDSDLPF